jgi:Xaa-Pro aminopeptidase
MAAAGVDAMLITDLVNVRYLTGFTGSNAGLLVFGGVNPPVLATDSRYRTQAGRQAPDLEVAIERACGRHLAHRAVAAGSLRIGFESHVVTVDGYDSLCQALDSDSPTPGARLVRASGLVESLREVKDDGEVALLRTACQAADAALASLVSGGGLRPGRTERAVARELESHMLDHGADAPSFETIVAAGANSAVPHHRPTDAELGAGDFVKIDFGALVGGYHSDMTRTFVLGAAADWQRETYELVLAAQRAGLAALEPGADLAGIDGAARRVIDAAGFAENFGHGLGHGVGLQIHEAPGINAAAVGVLQAGSVVTVEPGVYLPGRGGVRIEDTVLVTEKGTESLSRFPRELTVLD